MEGRPAEAGDDGGSAADRRELLEDTDAATGFRDDQVAVVAVILVVAGGVLGAATTVFLLRRDLAWLPRLLSVAALGFLGFIPAVYLARLIPFYALGAIAYYTFLVVVAAVLALLYDRLRRQHGLDPVILALGVIVVLLLTDAVVGAPLQFNSAARLFPQDRRPVHRVGQPRLRGVDERGCVARRTVRATASAGAPAPASASRCWRSCSWSTDCRSGVPTSAACCRSCRLTA